MVYIDNTTDKQNVFIPRNDSVEIYVSPYQRGYEDGLRDGGECPLTHGDVVVTQDRETFTPPSGYVGFIDVDVDATEYGNSKYENGFESGYTSGVNEQKGKLTSTAFTRNDTYSRPDGWSHVEVNVDLHQQEKQVSVSADTTVIVPDEGYTGMDKVTVDASGYGQDKYDSGYTSGYTHGKRDGADEQKAKLGSVILTENSAYTRTDGWSAVTVAIPTTAITETLTAETETFLSTDRVTGLLTNSNCWFDTGIIPNGDTELEIVLGKYPQSNTSYYLMGSDNGGSSYGSRFGVYNTVFIGNWTRSAAFVGGEFIEGAQKDAELDNVYILNKSGLTVNGTTSYTRYGNVGTIDYTMFINGINCPDYAEYNYRAGVFIFKDVVVKQSGTTVAHYVPAINNGVVCFYDEINDNYLYSLGSDNPTAITEDVYFSSVTISASALCQDYYDSGYTSGYTDGSTGGSCTLQSKSYGLESGFTGATIVPDGGYDGMSAVTVSDNGYGQAKYDSGYTSGYTDGSTGSSCNLQEKNVSQTAQTQTYYPDTPSPASIETSLAAWAISNYIDTGIHPTTATTMRIKYQGRGITSVDRVIGVHPSDGASENTDLRFFQAGSNSYLDYNTNRVQTGTSIMSGGVDYDFTVGNNYVYDNKNERVLLSSTTQTDCLASGCTIRVDAGSIRIYEVIIEEDGVEVFHGVPSNENGVVGLYDEIGESLHTINSSSYLTLVYNSGSTGYDGLSAITVNASAYGQTRYVEGQNNIKNNMSSTAFTQNNTYTNANGWSSVTVNVPTGSSCNLQEKSVVMTAQTQTFIPDASSYGLGYIGKKNGAAWAIPNLIDTEIHPTDNTTIRVKYKGRGRTSDRIVGTVEGYGGCTDSKDFRIFDAYQSTLWIDIGNARNYFTGNTVTTSNQLYDFTMGNNFVTDNINDVTRTFTTENVETAYTICVDVGSIYVQEVIIQDNGVTVFDGVAANENGVVGLRDLIGGNLYTLYTGSSITLEYVGGSPVSGYDGMSAITVSASALCQDYYDSGYTDGYSSGYTDGYADGYDSGYTSGKTDGCAECYQDGYNDGFDDGIEYGKDLNTYLTFEAIENGTIGFKYVQTSAHTGTPLTISYSINGGNWNNIQAVSSTSANQITVVSGDTVRFKSQNSAFRDIYFISNISEYISNYFTTDCNCYLYGNVMSLLYGDNFADKRTVGSLALSRVFVNNSKIYNHSSKRIVLPATALSHSCYSEMFMGCTALTTAPELPATSLASSCYYLMFGGCISLVNAPELPAMTLAESCYESMFDDCTSLVNAPELKARTLAVRCYYSMFGLCSGLTTAPALPATSLENGCYIIMFHDCTGLVNPPALPATTLKNNCYAGMFERCTSLVNAPELPARELKYACYSGMFDRCSNLSYIKCLATSIDSGATATGGWVNGISANGTFVKDANATFWTTGIDGIPSGWTVQNV